MRYGRILWFAGALVIYAIVAFNVMLAVSEIYMLVADRSSMQQVVGSEAACGMFVQYCSWRIYVALDLVIFAIAAASIASVFLWKGRAQILALSICAAAWVVDLAARLWLDDMLRSLLRPWFHEV